jgi:hypothetical protein
MHISLRSLYFIIGEEVGSRADYEKKYIRPVWPKGDSGITIGIGYDLGYHTAAEITRDWAGLAPASAALIAACAGKKGTSAQGWLSANPALQAVVVPYEIACQVFIKASLPKASREALNIYPGLEKLMPDAVGALVSMVFNRGSSLDGERRAEMKAIGPLIPKKDYAGIAALIDRSKRLWVGIGMDGLVKRREAEAAMVRTAVRQYAQNESVTVLNAA